MHLCLSVLCACCAPSGISMKFACKAGNPQATPGLLDKKRRTKKLPQGTKGQLFEDPFFAFHSAGPVKNKYPTAGQAILALSTHARTTCLVLSEFAFTVVCVLVRFSASPAPSPPLNLYLSPLLVLAAGGEEKQAFAFAYVILVLFYKL